MRMSTISKRRFGTKDEVARRKLSAPLTIGFLKEFKGRPSPFYFGGSVWGH